MTLVTAASGWLTHRDAHGTEHRLRTRLTLLRIGLVDASASGTRVGQYQKTVRYGFMALQRRALDCALHCSGVCEAAVQLDETGDFVKPQRNRVSIADTLAARDASDRGQRHLVFSLVGVRVDFSELD